MPDWRASISTTKSLKSLGIPYEPARWSKDLRTANGVNDHDHILKQIRVQELINMFRVRGHLNAHLDPLNTEPPALHPEFDLATYGLSIWDLQRTFRRRRFGGTHRSHSRRDSVHLA